jgi:hypothetical protein
MERLPTELWTDILFRSCVSDGGHTTASALSATCTHIRALIAPFQYDTVVLASLRAVHAFTHGVVARAERPPAVTRLFVLGMKPTSVAVADAHIRSVARGSGSHAQLSAAGLDELLEKLSPTLQHLAILPSLHDALEFLLVPTTLPFVTELTIGTSRLAPRYTDGLGGSAALRAELVSRLPALRRLHFTQPTSDVFAVAVPAHVTHLRFSNARVSMDALELVRLLWSRGVLRRETLESVVLQPLRLREHCATPAALLPNDVGYTERAVIVSNGHRHYDTRQVLAEWLDRTRGGLGCWHIPNDAIRRTTPMI